MKKVILILTGILILIPFVLAEEKKDKTLKHYIVVTATKTEQPQAEIGSSTTVITADDLKKTGKENVLEALRSVPGLDVAQTGGVGKLSNIFIRGSGSEHTLVMIDGVEMNDPMSPGRSFDFAHLTVDNIERIEVVRGPQSTLYGSDAMGGVIHIITKKGKGKPKLFISVEGGTYNTFREAIGLTGGTEWLNYSLGISRFDTTGFSSSHKKYGNTERDGYGNTSLSIRVGFTPVKNLNINSVVRYTSARNDLDLNGGEGGDDPNYTDNSKQLFFRTQVNLRLLNGKWEQKISFSLSNHNRNNQNDKDTQHPYDSMKSFYNARMLKIDWQHNFYLHKTNTLTIGLEYEEEKGDSEYSWESAWGPGRTVFPKKMAYTTGFYLQDGIKLLESFFITLGMRVDNHSCFGSVTTYRIAPAYFFKTGTKFKATYGTGFKAASLYQLYAPATAWCPIGNENLKPEKSKGWDVGIEQYLLEDRLTLGATYFRNDFEDLIQFDWTRGHINIAKVETKGMEIFISALPLEDLVIQGNYTYTDTEDKEIGEKLLRRPKHKGNLSLNYRFSKKGNINLGVIYVGERDDLYPYPYRVEAEAYTLINLAAFYDITENLQLFCRMDNLFDKDYEEIKGWGTARRSFYGGLKATF
ncbi:Vitamin B12 transporter BtuB [subsurface metagenome]